MRRRQFNANGERRIQVNRLAVNRPALVAHALIQSSQPTLLYSRCEVAVFDALANNGIGCRVVRIGHLRLRYRVRSLAVYLRGVIRLLFACFFRGVALRDKVVVIVLHVLCLPLCKPDARTDGPCELVYRHRVRHGRLPHKVVDSLVLRLRDLAYKLPAVVLDKVIDKTKLRVEQRASIFGKKVGRRLLYCRFNKRRVMVNDEFAVILLPLREVARGKLALKDRLTQFCVCNGILLRVYLLVQEGGELWTLSVDKRVEFIKRRLLAHPKHPPLCSAIRRPRHPPAQFLPCLCPARLARFQAPHLAARASLCAAGRAPPCQTA